MEAQTPPAGRPMLTFGEAISNCFKKYATFTGRARRSEYWYFVLFVFIISVACNLLQLISHSFVYLSYLFSLALMLPNIAVMVRRLHDVGKSGWWYFATFIAAIPLVIISLGLTVTSLASYPVHAAATVHNQVLIMSLVVLLLALILVAYSIVLVVWCCGDSHKETNRYGPSPKYGEESSDTVW